MEIDKLKEFWEKDHQELPEVSLKKQDKIYSPLEMIKINMKTEFWLLIITLPGLLYGFPFHNSDENIKTIATFEIILSICFMSYFYIRFVKLYRMLKSTSINTNYNLFNIKTQLLVCKEIYIAYYITYIPLAFLLSLINVNFHLDNVYYIAIFAVSMLTSILIVFLMIKFWIYHMYGKYIKEVVTIIDDLNGIKLTETSLKKETWFEKTQRFFSNKYGLKGHVFNTVIWFFSSYLLLNIAFIIVIFIVLVVGIRFDIIDKNLLIKVVETLYK